MELRAVVIAEPVEQEATLPRLPPASDFHQCGTRLRWFARVGALARLVMVEEGNEVVVSAVLEQTAARWFLWKGPSGGPPSADRLATLLGALRGLRPVTVILQPEWADEAVLTSRGFSAEGAFSTLLVSAAGTDAEILGRMKDSAQRRVRRGVRAGLEVVTGASWLSRFYPVYAEAMRAAASPDFATLDELEALLENPRVHLFVATLKGDVTAGAICFEHRDSLEARYVATDAVHRRIGPLNFLHYKILQQARDMALHHLDLSGLAVGEVDEKLASINRFKEGFGGIRFDYPIFSQG